MDTSSILELLGIAALLLLGALIAAGETALVHLSRPKLLSLMRQHPVQARSLEAWLANPNRLLAAIAVGINIVVVAASFLATLLAQHLAAAFQIPMILALAATPVLMTIIVVVLGEVVPKVIAIHNPEPVALALVNGLHTLEVVISPVTRALVLVSNWIVRLVGARASGPLPVVTEADILTLVTFGHEEGVLDKEEKEMIHSIFEFGDRVARQVMVPRPEMICASEKLSFEEMLGFVLEAEHTRVPVYQGTVDTIVGIVHLKDLVAAVRKGKPISAADIIREPYFIPETKKLDDLLREFQEKRMHMAIVVDEYGGTAGLVTMEDLLEEIVGEIRDEHDVDESPWRKVDEQTWSVEALITLDDLKDQLQIELPRGSYNTLSGFLYDLAGRAPREREMYVSGSYEFTIEKVAKWRIVRVTIRRAQTAAEPGGGKRSGESDLQDRSLDPEGDGVS
jgi:CBS domain containing-hemolysin-like protein